MSASQPVKIRSAQQEVPLETSSPSCKKITLIVTGVLLVLGSALATWLLYGRLENWSFMALGVGTSLGVALIVLGACENPIDMKLPSNQRAVFAGGQLKGRTDLVGYSLIASNPIYRQQKVETVRKIEDQALTPLEDRAIGALDGMAVGDSVGVPFEFMAYQDEPYTTQLANRFQLTAGQWTDDTSMGLCLADTLLVDGHLDEAQLMAAFQDWWYHGYNNAFTVGQPKSSVGLGGNIGQSFQMSGDKRNTTGAFATDAGDENTSGNGSLMRLGPVALVAIDLAEARDLAARQSRVTHQGVEAAGCCELMATLLFTALHHPDSNPKNVKAAAFASIENFQCNVLSVVELAQSLSYPSKRDENWNWKSPTFTFNADRLKAQPGYIGSYAMDGLAMALHCVWTTDSFEAAILKAGTHGGDADTVAAIAGQIAGAIYGYTGIPSQWTQGVQQWDRGGEIATRATLLLAARERKLREV